MKISHVACPCGNAYCRDRHLVGIGKFVQGSGFDGEEAERIVTAMNRELSPGMLRLATDAHMIGSVTYLHGQGLGANDQPTNQQLRDSMTAGIRAAFRAAGFTFADER